VRKISPLFELDFLQGPSVESAIASKVVLGGTAEGSVRLAITQLELKLKQLEKQP